MASSGDGDNDLMLTRLRDMLWGVNGPLYYFYNIMYGGEYSTTSDNDITFHPALSGYTLIFMQPPHLSGYIENNISLLDTHLLKETVKLICFIAVDFTPPSIQVTASELPSRSGSLPYATEVSGTGQLSISYLDDSFEHNFGFHKVWISYIEDITRGAMVSTGAPIAPSAEYYTPGGAKFGEIDYATTAYVIKFKPVRSSNFPDDIIYVGKATGIFPINNPDKEVIGRRDGPELITVTYNYPCANYRQWTAGVPQGTDNDEYLKKEFLQDILSQ